MGDAAETEVLAPLQATMLERLAKVFKGHGSSSKTGQMPCRGQVS